VRVISIRRAQLADEEILGQLDAATWTDDVSPAPAPPLGSAFFNERTSPDDVLVAEVDAVVAGCAKLGRSSTLPSRQHVLELSGLTVDPAGDASEPDDSSSRPLSRRQASAARAS
jgi:hypothetical protein